MSSKKIVKLNEYLNSCDERISRSVEPSKSGQPRECEGELNDKRSTVKCSSEEKENSRQSATKCDTRLNKTPQTNPILEKMISVNLKTKKMKFSIKDLFR